MVIALPKTGALPLTLTVLRTDVIPLVAVPLPLLRRFFTLNPTYELAPSAIMVSLILLGAAQRHRDVFGADGGALLWYDQ